jgi:hypothetical protein
MAFIANWIGGVLFPPSNDRSPKIDEAPFSSHPGGDGSVSQKASDHSRLVMYRGRHLKDIPIMKLKKALVEEYGIVAADTALRGELMHLLATAIAPPPTTTTTTRPAIGEPISTSSRQLPAQSSSTSDDGDRVSAPSSRRPARAAAAAAAETTMSSKKRVRNQTNEEEHEQQPFSPPVGAADAAPFPPRKFASPTCFCSC